VQRHRNITWARPAGAALTALHLAFVSWLTLRSLSATWVAAGNVTPLGTIQAGLALGTAGAPERLGAGLVLLAPLGVLLPLAGGRADVCPMESFARTALVGLALSLGFEMARTGLSGQVFDVDRVLLNVTGVAVAHLVVVPLTRSALRRRARRRADGAPQGASTAVSQLSMTP
jgi:glycopeptide antibiotics resistance protein